ncbi:hypothetical protein LUZ62_019999 [Rhynchospora pubera]|uniref:WRKY domain-containing protein n=1 Tax=Rhynchospora pubera TaxID=906938 RepID=A0AAV8GP53_9POAL|nr:hypothetical protein LUZ62_019999 [Rhynchospora pubera]
MPMGNSNLEREAVIREVGRGYDIIKQLQGLLQLKTMKGEDAIHMHELAQPLFREGLQALNHALCIMRSGVGKFEVKSDIKVIESGLLVPGTRDSLISYELNPRIENGCTKRKRVVENSWIDNTTMPYEDGYQWRKYGDKKITGSNFSRSYFRCTYKEEQGCQAKKIVQQTRNEDVPSFQVTYTNKHTCYLGKTSPSAPQKNPFGSIKQDNDNNQMLQLQECIPGRAYDDERQIFTGVSMVESNCEWDIDSLLRDLVEYASYDCLLT